MADPTWETDQKAIAYLLWAKGPPTSDITPIYPELYRRAKQVESRARFLVGKDTGELANSIELTDRRFAYGWRFTITAHARHAMAHHEGSKPHKIQGPVTFPGRGGAVITVDEVNHPGTRANPFLRDALDAFHVGRDIVV